VLQGNCTEVVVLPQRCSRTAVAQTLPTKQYQLTAQASFATAAADVAPTAAAAAAVLALQTTCLQANAATLAPLSITRELVRGLALGQDDDDDAAAGNTDADGSGGGGGEAIQQPHQQPTSSPPGMCVA
jgi:hypothetical protein